jgi:glycosyltransferase involved in cell wall biosynthesis
MHRKTQSERVVVFTGPIDFAHGLHVAIAALVGVHIRRDIVLRIAGPMDDADYWAHCSRMMRRAALNNPRLRVEYLGEQPEPETLYAEADLVVVPAVWGKDMSAAVSAAVVHGAAVVAADVVGAERWIEHEATGLLVQPNDVSGFSHELTRLLADDGLRATLRDGLARLSGAPRRLGGPVRPVGVLREGGEGTALGAWG